MGLFKAKPKTLNESYDTPDAPEKKQKKKFGLFKGKTGKCAPRVDNKSSKATSSPSNETPKTLELTTETPKVNKRQPGDPYPIDENGFPIEEDVDLPADIPKSILAWAPNGVLSDLGLEEKRCDDGMTHDGQDIDADSLGSPISKFRMSQLMEANKTESTIPLDPVDSTREPPDVDIHSPPSMRYLSYYITALSAKSSPGASSDPSSQALRSLFSLSEHVSSHKDRVGMVHWKSQDESSTSLVPALLDFLKRCKRDSSEQYLAMLVLNNVSIPHENKRRIALEFDGVKTLGQLLCRDPGCHLLLIILVNLTFCEADIRKDLFSHEDGTNLIATLTYALLLSSLSNEQLATLPPIPLADSDGVSHSPRKLLSILTTNLEEFGLCPYNHHTPDCNAPPLTFDDSAFAETARWSLCVLKNLTRPDKVAACDHVVHGNGAALAACALIDAGVVPLLLRIVRLNAGNSTFKQDHKEVGGGNSNTNNSCSWSLNSAQDAALYTLLHLATVPEIRGALNDCKCHNELLRIVECGRESFGNEADSDDMAQLGLQTIKAVSSCTLICKLFSTQSTNCRWSFQRIALSYLIEARYGQPQSMKGFNTSTVANREIILLTGLLSNCLHSRPKDGAGGYSSSSFSLKSVLYCIRCLLVDRQNRLAFASTSGAGLNTLLVKTMALYSFNCQSEAGKVSAMVDSEAAEYAVFSLYLISNYGFHRSVSRTSEDQFNFLPAQFGSDAALCIDTKIALSKILSVYSKLENTSPAGNHAATQLMLRARYLCCEGTAMDLVDAGEETFCMSDFDLDQDLLDKIKVTETDRQLNGVPPSPDIFKRAIVRYQASASNIICVDPRPYPNGKCQK